MSDQEEDGGDGDDRHAWLEIEISSTEDVIFTDTLKLEKKAETLGDGESGAAALLPLGKESEELQSKQMAFRARAEKILSLPSPCERFFVVCGDRANGWPLPASFLKLREFGVESMPEEMLKVSAKSLCFLYTQMASRLEQISEDDTSKEEVAEIQSKMLATETCVAVITEAMDNALSQPNVICLLQDGKCFFTAGGGLDAEQLWST